MHVYSKIILCTINPITGIKGVLLKKNQLISITLNHHPVSPVEYIKDVINYKYSTDISCCILKVEDVIFNHLQRTSELCIYYRGIINEESINKNRLQICSITDLLSNNLLSKQEIEYVQKSLQSI